VDLFEQHPILEMHSRTLTEHIEQTCALIAETDFKDVTLVGHSYGGLTITSVAAILMDRMRRFVYVDAALPDPGQLLFRPLIPVNPLAFRI
jgi:pimeloyl-ACP methyl ester carboxylesterase